MIDEAGLREVIIAGRRLEVLTIAGPATRAPIVMLHEGLGSISAWRDFPVELAARTGRRVIAYSRSGYGRSQTLQAPFDVRYMHDEGEVVLPALLAALEVPAPVLFGHSDGASIALIFAATHPRASRALVLEAPHVFVEPMTIESIAHVKATVDTSNLIEKLARHHVDPAKTFWAWNDIWLDPKFAAWNIADRLPAIRVPMLLVQGRDDEYGTMAQIEAILRVAPNSKTLVFDRSGHSPHRTQREAVLAGTANFLAGVA